MYSGFNTLNQSQQEALISWVFNRRTPEPKISSYPKNGAGLAAYATDTATRLREANDDKTSMQLYVDKKREQEESPK